MTTRKAWETAVGERTGDQGDGDSLLTSVKNQRERQRMARAEEIEVAEHNTKIAKLDKDKASAEASVEKTEAKNEGDGFKVTGGMHIDLDADRKEAKEAADKLRAQLAENANRTLEENNKLRSDVHAAERREDQALADLRMAEITAKMDSRSPAEVISDIRSMAAELGLKAPDPSVGDASLQLQILQLNHAEAQRAREFEWQMQKDRDDREDRKEERAEDRKIKAAEVSVQREKMEMFAGGFESVGTAIAKGMAASGQGAGVAAGPEQSARAKTVPGITAAVGEKGTAECVNCQQAVGIGPTATMAECAGCGTKYPIRRVQPVSKEVEEE